MSEEGPPDVSSIMPLLPFVLSTHWRTIVDVDPLTGQLSHSAANECLFNLVLFEHDGKIFFRNRLDNGTFHISGNQHSFDISKDKDTGKITIRKHGLFASAEPNGNILINRTSANAWETFSPLLVVDACGKRLSNYVSVPQFRRGCSVPKIIHQTFLGRDVPKLLQKNVEELRDSNPDYIYRLWKDKDVFDFIYDVYGYKFLLVYMRINRNYGACRADLFRYLCIFKLGGVYLDIKSGVNRKLSDIIRPDDVYLLSHWDNEPGGRRQNFGTHSDMSHFPGGEYQQWHVIAAPGHPFLERVIETVVRNISNYDPARHGVGRIGALRVTGPFAYTKAIKPIVDLHPHRMIKSESDGLVYNAVGDHIKILKNHYSLLKTPVVI
jgi:hypothetical protein